MATPKRTPHQISQVSGLVAGYISSQHEKFAPRGVPLTAQQRAAVAPFFAPELLGNIRVLVLQGERVTNPDFYPMLRNLGFNNLPDQSPLEVNAYTLEDRLDANRTGPSRCRWKSRAGRQRADCNDGDTRQLVNSSRRVRGRL